MLMEHQGSKAKGGTFHLQRYFLGKKIEGLYASLRFEDLEIFRFQGGLNIEGFEVITCKI
jgi:hypothetical protein